MGKPDLESILAERLRLTQMAFEAYSIGHWEGDTLVVETVGFNDRSWLDGWGHPHSEKLRVIERFHRVDFGHMDFQITFDDPETLTKPLTVSLPVDYQPDTEMLEFVCENERDTPHLARADQSLKLSPETLAKYAGTYEYAGGRPPDAPKLPPWLITITVTMAGGRLYHVSLILRSGPLRYSDLAHP